MSNSESELLVFDRKMLEARDYWAERLSLVARRGVLKLDYPRSSPSVAEIDSHCVRLSDDLFAKITTLTGGSEFLLYTTLMTALKICLRKYTGSRTTVVGSPARKVNGDAHQPANALPIVDELDDRLSFREYLLAVRQTLLDAYARQRYPFDRMVQDSASGSRESWCPLFEVALTLAELHTDLPPLKNDLTITLTNGSSQLSATATFNRRILSAESVRRFMRHFEYVLAQALDDTQKRVADLQLCSAAERHELLVEWNDTRQDFPHDLCLHQLFEDQVRESPDAVAVVSQEEQLTYQELDARANQLAHHLRTLGGGPDVLIAVCMNRSLEMMVGLLGILKSGAAYVPLDPHYPPERLSGMLADCQASIVLTQRGLLPELPPDGVRAVFLDEQRAVLGQHPRCSPIPDAHPENLAYVIYTSGSTGKPKGVGVSHRNLVQSTSARLRFYKQRAARFLLLSSIAFDSSVAGIFSTLCQGGALVLPPPGAELDVAVIRELIRQQHVTHLLCVPAFYSELLRDHAGEKLGTLQVAIVAGESCPVELVRHHHEQLSHAALFNEYGPTEATVWSTVFDCRAQPISSTVPIGRPISNTQIYLLDRCGLPVPAGAVGELYIGGEGLARGYLRHPALTAEKFIPHPFVAGAGMRLYRTGDMARYLTDGNIEFVGRDDTQVKVHGFRIELGEIEAALRQHAKLREAVVVLREDQPGEKRLVAYVVHQPDQRPTSSELRGFLKERLADFMVPAVFVPLTSLPLTPNGKLDRRALPAPSGARPELIADYVVPRTDIEKRLADVWSQVLGINQVGLHDNFFELGGDSILSIQIIARANPIGLHFTPKQLFEHPTIAELAGVVTTNQPAEAEQGPLAGDVPLTPIQHWFFCQDLPAPDHFNQAVLLEVRPPVDAGQLEMVFEALVSHHDALRLRFQPSAAGWRPVSTAAEETVRLSRVDLSALAEDQIAPALEAASAQLQATLNISNGPLLRVALFDLGADKPKRLLVIVHHLVIDGVSWRILLEDLQTAYGQTQRGQRIELPRKTTSFARWSQRLSEYARHASLDDELAFWTATQGKHVPRIPVDDPAGDNRVASACTVSVSLRADETQALLTKVPEAYRTQINDLLLTALVDAFFRWTGQRSLLVHLEGHGREELFADVDLSRTVGWFTTLYPVLLEFPQTELPGEVLKSVKEQLRAIPKQGIGYGVLRYLSGSTDIADTLASLPQPELVFNYLGQFDQALADDSPFAVAREPSGSAQSPHAPRGHVLGVHGIVNNGQLQMGFTYSRFVHQGTTVKRLADRFLESLRGLIAHCQSPAAGGCTPSDFPLARLDQTTLDGLVGSGRDIQDVYPLSPIQSGLLFHSLYAPDSGMYFEQFSCQIHDLDIAALKQAWQRVVDRHAILRSSFVWAAGSSEPVQVVHRRAPISWNELDWRDSSAAERQKRLDAFLEADREAGFDIAAPLLMRIALLRVDDNSWQFVWSHHHVILDGWSAAILLREVMLIYEGLVQGHEVALETPRPFKDYIQWLRAQDVAPASSFWRQILRGFTSPTPLGFDRHERGSRIPRQEPGTREIRFPSQVTQSLRMLARQQRLSLNTMMEGTWALLLSRYSGNRDVLFGVGSSGRPASLQGIESMVGLFVSTLPMRVDVDPDASLLPWLQQLQARQLEILEYEHSSLIDVHGWSEVPRNVPLFESGLVFENYPVDRSLANLSHVDSSDVRIWARTNYPLNLLAVPDGDELSLQIRFDRSRFDDDTVAAILGHFGAVLEGMVANPQRRLSDLPILTEPERHRLLMDWNKTEMEYAQDACLHELFEKQVRHSPDAIALSLEDEQVTYRELNARSNQLANSLQEHGVGPEVLVGVFLERSVEMVVGLLGILKAGGGYLPLDPEYPADRLAFMLQDARVPLVLTQQRLVERLPDHQADMLCVDTERQRIARLPTENLGRQACARNVAYVIYTSGSTGRPKGSLAEHRGLCNVAKSQAQVFGLGSHSKVLQLASLSFDGSLAEIVMALTTGATLCLARKESLLPGPALSGLLQERAITMVTFPPSILSALPVDEFPALELICVAGETCSAELVAKWGRGRRFLNFYGHTETTIWATFAECIPDGKLPHVGRPIGNTQIYILDADLQPVPVGITGELHLGGAGVGRGYLGRPALTAERFVPNPYGDSGTRLYKSRDLLSYRSDGAIDFVGRIDHQVKIRGFRIELGEIEAVLREHPAVREALILAREVEPGDKRLVAYVVPEARPDDARQPAPAMTAGDSLELWPSVAEYFVYDELLYHSLTSDEHRNARYQAAIRPSVQDKVVVDIGTGADAILARFCVAAGARKVYAVELLEDTYQRARACIKSLGLEDRIILVHGDATRIELPEKADVCVSEIVGPIGSMEGAVPILNAAWRLLREGAIMIPSRSITRIAAVSLPDAFLSAPRFNNVASHYVEQVFQEVGHPFDLRVCLKNVSRSNLISNVGTFEDLDFGTPSHPECTHQVSIEITREGRIDGFLLWLELHTAPGEILDTLDESCCWLPVYFPVFSPGVRVAAGDRLQVTCQTLLSANGVNPDYRVSGRLIGSSARTFDYRSPHETTAFRSNAFYNHLFSNGQPPSAPVKAASDLVPQLRDYLQRKLPDYMVPSAFMVLESMPLSPNGKIDRRALPAPDSTRPELADAYLAPRNPHEEMVAAIWCQVLGIQRIGVRDNFFELGGHSLLATQVVSRLRAAFKIDLPLHTFFESPTIASLTSEIDRAIGSTQRADLQPLIRVDREVGLPLSFAQERLWFLHQLEPDSTAYNIPSLTRLTGPLNVGALQQAFGEIIRRHEILRTKLAMVKNGAVQVIRPEAQFGLPVVDLRARPPTGRMEQSWRLAGEAVRRPFDLSQPPLLRATLVQLDDREYVLLLVLHHMVSDGWSVGSLIRELSSLYEAFSAGRASVLVELPIQYVDYAVWQRQRLEDGDLDGHIAYWKEHLYGAQPVLDLPTDRPRPAVQTSPGAVRSLDLSGHLLDALQALSQQQSATLFMTLLAAFQTLLHRYTGQADILVGTPLAGRNREEIEGLIGFFINTLVMRADVSENPTFSELLAQVRETALDAYAHQDVPFEILVDELEVQRDLSRTPLFQVMFILQNFPLEPLELAELRLTPLDMAPAAAKFDLTLECRETAQGLRASLEYNTDLFDAETIDRMLRNFETLLDGIVANPQRPLSDLPLVTEAESTQLLVAWNETASDYPQLVCLHELIESQVHQSPDAVAAVLDDQQLTYRELNARANQLAHHLRNSGVGPEVFVGICMERTLELVVGVLGILKAGGAYVPLDPSYPRQRLEYMLHDASLGVLLTTQDLELLLPQAACKVICIDRDAADIAAGSRENPPGAADADNTCYVIYTSGSTGAPKGVVITHRAVLNTLFWLQEHFALQPWDTVAQKTASSFTDSVWELFWPLLAGSRIAIISADQVTDPQRLYDALALYAVTYTQFVPPQMSAFLAFVDSRQGIQGQPSETPLPNLKWVFNGGEALPAHIAQEWYAHLPQARIGNIYGMTESAIYATHYTVPSGELPEVLIGKPIGNSQAYVFDAHGRPCPVNVAGELCLGGIGLTRGYWGRPELTAEKLVPNPYGPAIGTRLYRTGDRARWLSNGQLEYLGRMDRQVKIRGFRVELGEVEAVLGQHPDIRQAAVILREDRSGEKELVAYAALHDSARATPPNSSQLRRFLLDRLPQYMVPAWFVVLHDVPLTPSGKVDRRRLPAPVGSRPELEAVYMAPRTPLEQSLVRLWGDVLGVKQIGVHDNFFHIGGHSILGTQLVSRIRDAFHVDLPLRSLFEAPTIKELSLHVQREIDGEAHLPPAYLLEPTRRDADLPLSFAQERLWFLHQLDPDSTAYNVSAALRLTGPLHLDALGQAFSEIIRRHEPLRTTFSAAAGRPRQQIGAAEPVSLRLVDLSPLPEATRVEQCQSLAAQEAAQPFDLLHGPLLRLTVIRLGNHDHGLLVTMHHVVSDGWSTGVLVGELSTLYEAFSRGQSSPLPELSIQYADYAVWQRQWLDSGALETQLSYWVRQLKSAPPVLELPSDRPRPPVQTFRGASQSFALSERVLSALKALGQQQGSTLFMTLLAAFQVLLHRYTGQPDILVGTPIAGRNRREIEGLIGFFVHTVVMRGDLRPQASFCEFLDQVREVALEAHAHQDLPFEYLVDQLQVERDLSHTPLFQVMFVLQNAPLEAIKLSDLTLRYLATEQQTSQFDLTLTCMETDQGLLSSITYNTALYDEVTIQRMWRHFETLLEGIVADPRQKISDLPLLTDPERAQLLVEWNATQTLDPPEISLVQLFEQQVERTPDVVALGCESQALTYRELNARANRLAHYLRRQGIGPDVCVGLCLHRSLEMVVGILGILKAGGAYVPLDPAYPQQRLRFMLQDAHTRIVVTEQRLVGDLLEAGVQPICLDTDWESIARESVANPLGWTHAENLAYVIYTSGSTGAPKGTAVSHRNVTRLLTATDSWFGFNSQDVWTLFHSCAFDFSVWEIWGALLYGGRLVVVPWEVSRSPELFYPLLQREGVTVLNQTPSAFGQLMAEDRRQGGAKLPLRYVIFGGEALDMGGLQSWLERHGSTQRLINMYGITETTVHVTYRPISCQDVSAAIRGSAIGQRIPDLQIHLLDQGLQPVPQGVAGEIHVGGAGLARGYVNRPTLTAERFIPNPFSPHVPGARLYRSGDQARYRAPEDLEYVGRIDEQVKIRGFRIELGEIESALREHPAVREAVLLAREDEPGDKRLVAYVVPAEDRLPAISGLRAYLQKKLPDYMIPAAFVPLESFPLTPSGKIDRRAFPAPDQSSRELAQEYLAPRTPDEQMLAAIWSEVLGIQPIGVHENFFTLGGHSLLATQVISEVRVAFQLDLPVRELFESPTIAEFARAVERCREASQEPPSLSIHALDRNQFRRPANSSVETIGSSKR